MAVAIYLRPLPPQVTAPAFWGTVADRDGRGVAGARIDATWIGEDDAPLSIAEAAVDARGRYRLEASSPAAERGVMVLRVRAEGFGSVGRRVEAAERRQDFRLVRGATQLTVRVTADDGALVSAADVVASIEPTAGSPDAMVVHRGRTAADGTWTLDGLAVVEADIHWIVQAPAHGRAFGTLRKPAGDAPVEIVAHIEPGSELLGELVDREGAPVADAGLIAREADGPWRESARSDRFGRARIGGAPRATDLSVEVTGDWVLAGAEQAAIRLEPYEPTRYLTLVVEPAGRIDGRVVDTRGTPIAGAVVAATPADHVLTRSKAVGSGPDGRFSVRALRVRTAWQLEVRHPQFAPAFVDGIAADTQGLSIELREGGTLVGAVDDDRGHPYPGIEVYAHRVARGAGDAVDGLREYATATTVADGGFRIEHLSAGDYRVEVRSLARMDWSPTAAQVVSAKISDGRETALARMRVTRGASLRVLALGHDGTPIAHHKMKMAILPADRGGAPHRVDARTGVDGAFVIEHLVAGVYQLALQSEDHGFARSADLRLETGVETSYEARFADGFELTGAIIDADRRAVVGALVDAYRADEGTHADDAAIGRAPDNFSGNVTHSDESGRFKLSGLTAGTYRVRISSPRSVPLATEIRVPAPATPLALQLPRPATLRVRVLAGPTAAASVLIKSRDGAGFSASRTPDATGVAEFTSLPAGEYTVRAALDRIKETRVVVRAGDDQTVQFDGS